MKGERDVGKVSLTMPLKVGIVARNFLGSVQQCFLMRQKNREQTFVELHLLCAGCLLIISLNSSLMWLVLLSPGKDEEMETENVKALRLWILGKCPCESRAL